MYRVENKADAVDIYIYEQIGEKTNFWTGEKSGVSAERIIADLDEAGGKPVNIHIDSGGGDVFTGFAICSAIQRYKGKTTAFVDGLAASAASYIAVVCDEVKMSDFAYLMIHCASSYCYGNARYLEDVSKRLHNIDENLAQIYMKRSNLSIEEVLDYMDAETWFTAREAFDCGLCTEVIETEERMVACLGSEFASAYDHVPLAVSIGGEIAAKPASAGEGEDSSHADPIIPPTEDAFVVFDGKLYRKEAR